MFSSAMKMSVDMSVDRRLVTDTVCVDVCVVVRGGELCRWLAYSTVMAGNTTDQRRAVGLFSSSCAWNCSVHVVGNAQHAVASTSAYRRSALAAHVSTALSCITRSVCLQLVITGWAKIHPTK